MSPQTVILVMSSAVILAAFVVSSLAIWAIVQTGMVHKLRLEVEDLGEQLTRFMKREASRDVRAKKVASGKGPAGDSLPAVDPETEVTSFDQIAAKKAAIERAAFR